MSEAKSPEVTQLIQITKQTNRIAWIYILLLGVPLVLKDVFPSFFKPWFVSQSIFIGMALIMPVWLARSLFMLFYYPRKEKGRQSVVSVLFFFSLHMTLMFGVLYGMNRVGEIVQVKHENIDSIDGTFFRSMYKATNQRQRVLVAGFVYRQFGAILPYQLDTGEFKVFNPTDKDKKAFASQETA
ncbi:MAG: hypothetical protein MJK04_29875, partial [Psychrosphaera sp.]|nr:hypothetical protein [Psychrosphaera sp.]